MVIDLWFADKYDPGNHQHAENLYRRIHAVFTDFGVALCAYTDDNDPIGYIWYKHDTGLEGVGFSGKYAHIVQMGLFEQYQRRGIGTALLNEACERIKAAGGECVYTDTYAANDNSMSFYIKNKFTPVALLPGLNGVNDFGQVYMYKIF